MRAGLYYSPCPTASQPLPAIIHLTLFDFKPIVISLNLNAISKFWCIFPVASRIHELAMTFAEATKSPHDTTLESGRALAICTGKLGSMCLEMNTERCLYNGYPNKTYSVPLETWPELYNISYILVVLDLMYLLKIVWDLTFELIKVDHCISFSGSWLSFFLGTRYLFSLLQQFWTVSYRYSKKHILHL